MVMKKILLIVSTLIVLILLLAIFFLRSTSGYRSIYFVPEDAVMIIETKDPVQTWDKIVHSKAWGHFSTNEYFDELNQEILSYDSLINSSKLLLKLVGKKSVTMSQHPLGNEKYEYIYIVDVGKVAKYKSPEKLIKSVLGKGYEVTSRDYKDVPIVELFDLEEGSNYFMAFSEGKLIFSFEPKLVEKSIDASEKKIIGRDMKYLDVQSKIGGRGLLTVYFNYRNLSGLLNSLSPEAKDTYNSNTKYMHYSGLYFDIDKEGLLTLEGYTSFDDSTPEEYLGMLVEGENQPQSAQVIPLRLASMAKINFKDASDYFQKTMKSMSREDYEEYMKDVKKIEKKLKISLEKNLFSWMEDEIVMLQTQPSNLGRDNEFAAILHAKDSSKAAENLQFIWKQIKKNTPVKIKSVNYKGYSIDYIAFPGIIKALFGNALKKLEKPYIAQVGENVLLSNHPQTLKNIIDDYFNEESLKTSVDYYNFNKNLENKSSVQIYFEPPVLYHNLKAFVDSETWAKLKENKKYITCFRQGAVQISRVGDLMHFVLKAQYKPEAKEWKKQYYNSAEIFSMFNYMEPVQENENEEVKEDSLPQIIISDLDAKKFEDYYETGELKIEVELKDGLKHGTIKQYHPNGKLKLKGEYKEDFPTGKWKYYDEDGKLENTVKY